MDNLDINRIKEIGKITDEISPTFCLAKWHHTTIYLQTGETHSCFHPAPHAISLGEIEANPSAIHNTQTKIQERSDMMNGKFPKGCQYCWNIEGMGPDYISDRKERNASIYRPERLADILKDPLAPVNPEYIEISFGNECNFKCGYCHPKHSSSYYNEILKYGPVETVKNHRNDIDWFDIHSEENNPYVKAWWKWWPEVSKTLHILRVTGGEPLLQKSTWRIFDEIEKNPLPDLHLNLNSNLGVRTAQVEKLTEKVTSLLQDGKIADFKMFTSMDTWGKPAEYIRTGLDCEVWEKNLDTYLTKTPQAIDLMVTFNILNIVNFRLLLEKILEWRKKYNSPDHKEWQRVKFDVPHLKEPIQYDINILPKEEYMPYMYSHLKFIEDNRDNSDPTKFSDFEYEKFSRVVKYMETTEYPDWKLEEGRRDFYNWFTEYDIRRNVSFVETFPELVPFFEECKKHAW